MAGHSGGDARNFIRSDKDNITLVASKYNIYVLVRSEQTTVNRFANFGDGVATYPATAKTCRDEWLDLNLPRAAEHKFYICIGVRPAAEIVTAKQAYTMDLIGPKP